MMSGNGDRPAPLGQSYVERPPDAALAGVVSSTWIQQVAPDAMPYAQRNIPTGGVELLCPLGGVPRIVGPMTLPIVEVLAPGTTIVAIRFIPAAPSRRSGCPLRSLSTSRWRRMSCGVAPR